MTLPLRGFSLYKKKEEKGVDFEELQCHMFMSIYMSSNVKHKSSLDNPPDAGQTIISGIIK